MPSEGYPSLYPPRNVRATALYQLLESYYEQVKALWEDRFEKKYGFWRGFVDSVVARYLDCGTVEAGFARLRCEACGSERLLTLSCKQRGICPSCDAKRAAAFGAFLKDEILEDVGHSLVTFTLPKMLRGYFLRNRELLSDLARLAYETLQVLIAEAVDDERARPGVVAVPQTFGSLVNPHPHVHCLASRGVWHPNGQWTHVPYFDLKAAEKLWAHEVLRLLQQKGLLSDDPIALQTNYPVTIESGPAIRIRADADQLEQLLINLLWNAIDASQEKNGPVRVRWSLNDGPLQLLVEDEGPGLPQTANLFVPFFTTKAGGSGIGLVLSRQIAEAHGGTLDLENREDGPGCRVKLTLPVETIDSG